LWCTKVPAGEREGGALASGDLLGSKGFSIPHMGTLMYVPNDKMVMPTTLVTMQSKERVMESQGLGYTLSQPHANFPSQLLCCRGHRPRFHHSTWSENVLG